MRKVLVWLALINLLVTLISLGSAINKECKAFGDIILTVEYIIQGDILIYILKHKIKEVTYLFMEGNLLCMAHFSLFKFHQTV